VLTSPMKFQLRWNSGACGFRGEYIRAEGPVALCLAGAAPAAPCTRAAPATPVPAPAPVFGGIDQATRILLRSSRRQLDAAHTLGRNNEQAKAAQRRLTEATGATIGSLSAARRNSTWIGAQEQQVARSDYSRLSPDIARRLHANSHVLSQCTMERQARQCHGNSHV